MNHTFNRVNQFFSRNWKPQFLILGAQKAGTTTLYDILNHNENFCGSRDKETGFFINDIFYNKGHEWYLKQFELCGRNTIRFEATPFYLYHPDAPKRISLFNPRMKFIVMLREPASRCYSAWNMFRKFNEASANEIYEQFVQYSNPEIRSAVSYLLFTKSYPSFRQAVEVDLERYLSKSIEIEPSFVRRGIYFEQIESYLKYFSLDNFLFLEQRELNSLAELTQKLSDFFEISIDLGAMSKSAPSNVGDYLGSSSEDEETLSMLKAFYKPYNEKLFNQIGIRYDWNERVGLI